MAVNHHAVRNRDILAGNPLPGILGACLNGNAVIPDINMAVADAHIPARLGIDSIGIRRIGRIQDRQIVDHHIAAIDRIHRPAWGIHQRQITERHPAAIIEANQSRARILQLFRAAPVLLPPGFSIPVNGSAPGNRDIPQARPVDAGHMDFLLDPFPP